MPQLRDWLWGRWWTTGASIVETWRPGQPLPRPDDWESFARHGYGGNPTVYRCIRVKANAALEPMLVVTDGDAEAPEQLAENDPLVMLLADQGPELIETTLTHFDVFGNVYIRGVRSKRGNRVVGLKILNPARVEIVPGEDGEVATYEYRAGDKNGQVEKIDPDDIIHGRLPNPISEWYGLSPLAVAARWIDADNQAGDWVRAFFHNNATPSGILNFKARIGPQAAARYARQWREKFGRRGEERGGVAVLEGGEVTYQQVGARPADIDFGGILAQSEARISQVTGVPAILANTKIGLDRSTYANAEEARRWFWHNTMVSDLMRAANLFSLISMWLDDTPRQVDFDLSAVKALKEDLTKERLLYLRAWEKRVTTLDETRAAISGAAEQTLEPIGGDEGDARLPPPPAPVDGDGGAADGADGDGGDDGAGGDGDGGDAAAAAASGGCGHDHGDGDPPRIQADAEAYVAGLEEAATAAEDDIGGAWHIAVEEAAAAIDEAAFRTAIEAGDADAAAAALEPSADTMLDAMVRECEPAITGAVDAGAARAEERLALEAAFQLPPGSAAARALTRQLQKQLRSTATSSIAAFTRAVVDGGVPADAAVELLRLGITGLDPIHTKAIVAMRQRLLDEGLDAVRVAARIRAEFADKVAARARMIARTESVRAVNRGVVEMARETRRQGVVVKKMWRAQPDACDICAPMHLQRVELDAMFSAGFDHPPAHPHCRCWLDVVREQRKAA